MAIVTPADDILVSEGGGLFTFTASSAVSGGALVKPVGEYSVGHAAATNDNIIGVALYEAAAGDPVAVAGPGNIVRCCASGTIAYGADLYACATGKVDDNETYGGTAMCVGIALETASNNGAIRVLLK